MNELGAGAAGAADDAPKENVEGEAAAGDAAAPPKEKPDEAD